MARPALGRGWLLLCVAAICLSVGPAYGSIDLVKDGRTDFSVFAGAQATPRALAAAETLRHYIEAISGVRIPMAGTLDPTAHQIVLEVGMSRDRDLNLASLGVTDFASRRRTPRSISPPAPTRGSRTPAIPSSRPISAAGSTARR